MRAAGPGPWGTHAMRALRFDTAYRGDPQTCHPERRAKPEVEGSSHYRKCRGQIGAKILRLPSVAQDDRPFRIRRGAAIVAAYIVQRSMVIPCMDFHFMARQHPHQFANHFVEIDKPAFFGQLTLTIPISFCILYLGKFN